MADIFGSLMKGELYTNPSLLATLLRSSNPLASVLHAKFVTELNLLFCSKTAPTVQKFDGDSGLFPNGFVVRQS